MEKVKCILCGSEKCKTLFVGKDLLHEIPGEFPVVKCKCCGLVYTNLRPSLAEIEKYYPLNYEPFHHIPARSHVKSFRERMVQCLLNTESTFIPTLPKEAQVMEIGCATGWFLNEIKNKGWILNGIERNSRAANFTKRYFDNIQQGDIHDIELGSDRYDCIFAWMVLEHTHNPGLVLQKISRALKRKGLFIFSIPNIESIEPRIFKQYWFNYDLPRHLFHFGITTIQEMLEKNNLEIKKIIHIANFDSFMNSCGYFLRAKRTTRRLSEWFLSYHGSNSFGHKLIARTIGIPYMFIMQLIKKSGRIIIVAGKS